MQQNKRRAAVLIALLLVGVTFNQIKAPAQTATPSAYDISPEMCETLRPGFLAYRQGNFAEALRVFRAAALQGNPIAASMLGVMYSRGDGVSVDYHEAFAWFRKAAGQ